MYGYIYLIVNNVNGKTYVGKHPSEETLKKLSESHKGKHWKLVDGKRVWF